MEGKPVLREESRNPQGRTTRQTSTGGTLLVHVADMAGEVVGGVDLWFRYGLTRALVMAVFGWSQTLTI